MIFNFRIVSDEVDNFKREIQIDSTATFLDLKKAICDSVGYDSGQMSSFFLCDDQWEKEKEITFEDMDTDPGQDVWLMDETALDELILDDGQKLLYVFDYLTDRCFFIEMTKAITGRKLRDPLCTLSMGTPPPKWSTSTSSTPKSTPKLLSPTSMRTSTARKNTPTTSSRPATSMKFPSTIDL